MSWEKTPSLESFEELFREQFPKLFALGYSICHNRDLTKDCIQTIFIGFWEKRAQRTSVENVPAYLRKMLVREIMHQLRGQKQREQRHQRSFPLAASPSPESLLIEREQQELLDSRLQLALQGLPEQQRLMLQMRFQDGMSYDTIAEQTGKSKQTVYNQIYVAIKKLKGTLLLGLFFLVG